MINIEEFFLEDGAHIGNVAQGDVAAIELTFVELTVDDGINQFTYGIGGVFA